MRRCEILTIFADQLLYREGSDTSLITIGTRIP